MDDGPTLPTLAEVRAYGIDVFCWCNRCSHNGVQPIEVLIAPCDPGLLFPSVHGLLNAPIAELYCAAGHGHEPRVPLVED